MNNNNNNNINNNNNKIITNTNLLNELSLKLQLLEPFLTPTPTPTPTSTIINTATVTPLTIITQPPPQQPQQQNNNNINNNNKQTSFSVKDALKLDLDILPELTREFQYKEYDQIWKKKVSMCKAIETAKNKRKFFSGLRESEYVPNHNDFFPKFGLTYAEISCILLQNKKGEFSSSD